MFTAEQWSVSMLPSTALICNKTFPVLGNWIGRVDWFCLHEADEDAAGQLSWNFPLFEVLWVLEYQYQGIACSASASGDTTIPIENSRRRMRYPWEAKA